MYIRIEASNGLPIYEQIVRQIKFAIAEGTLVPGQLIPSVRELSRELAVNANTIVRAYQDLQNESIIETLRGRGLVVAPGATRLCLSQRQILVRERMEQVILEGIRSGLEPQQLTTYFEKALASIVRAEKKS